MAEGTRITYTLEGVLAALVDLPLPRLPERDRGRGATVEERGPEPPADLETAIEAPYRLIVSPSVRGAFRHSARPVGPPDRAELWRTHLTVRTDTGFDDEDADQRIVRALWNRDSDLPPAGLRPIARQVRP